MALYWHFSIRCWYFFCILTMVNRLSFCNNKLFQQMTTVSIKALTKKQAALVEE